jgi:hypothetical protein
MFQVFHLCLQTYVVSVTSQCFKNKLGVASPSLLFCCLASVSPPLSGVGWASAAPYFSSRCYVQDGTVNLLQKRMGRARQSPCDMRVPKGEGVRAPMCARTHVNGAASTGVRTRTSARALVRPFFFETCIVEVWPMRSRVYSLQPMRAQVIFGCITTTFFLNLFDPS